MHDVLKELPAGFRAVVVLLAVRRCDVSCMYNHVSVNYASVHYVSVNHVPVQSCYNHVPDTAAAVGVVRSRDVPRNRHKLPAS
jgi:hypothetical protein